MSSTRGAGALLCGGTTAAGMVSLVIDATGGWLDSLHAAKNAKSAAVVKKRAKRTIGMILKE